MRTILRTALHGFCEFLNDNGVYKILNVTKVAIPLEFVGQVKRGLYDLTKTHHYYVEKLIIERDNPDIKRDRQKHFYSYNEEVVKLIKAYADYVYRHVINLVPNLSQQNWSQHVVADCFKVWIEHFPLNVNGIHVTVIETAGNVNFGELTFNTNDYLKLVAEFNAVQGIYSIMKFVFDTTKFTGMFQEYTLYVDNIPYTYGIDLVKVNDKLPMAFYFSRVADEMNKEHKNITDNIKIRSHVKEYSLQTIAEFEAKYTNFKEQNKGYNLNKIGDSTDQNVVDTLYWVEGYAAGLFNILPYRLLLKHQFIRSLENAAKGYACAKFKLYLLENNMLEQDEITTITSNIKTRKCKKAPQLLRDLWLKTEDEYNNLINQLKEVNPTTGCAFILTEGDKLQWRHFHGNKKYLVGLYKCLADAGWINSNISGVKATHVLFKTFNLMMSDTLLKPQGLALLEDKFKDPYLNFIK